MESRMLLVATLAAMLLITEAEEQLQPSEPLATLDESSFNDRANSTLKMDSTYLYTLSNGYKCELTGFSHTRQYAMGFLRNKPGTASATVSGLVPGAQYAWKLYQFASHFKSANPLWVNGVSQGKTYQEVKKEATKENITMADPSGKITFEFRTEAHQVHLSGLAVAKIRPACEKSKISGSGYHAGVSKAVFTAYQAPDGKEWSWQQCAARCAEEPACEFWTLSPSAGIISSGGECSMMSGKTLFQNEPGYAEGDKDASCSEALRYQSDIASRQERVASIQKRVEAADLDLSQTKAAKQEVESKVSLQEGQIQDLTGQIQNLTGQTQNLTGQIQKLTGRIQELTGQKTQLTKSLEGVTMEKQIVTKELGSVREELKLKSEQLVNTQNELKSTSERLDSKVKELSDMSSSNQRLESMTQSLELKITASDKEKRMQEAEWTSKLQELTAKLHEVEQNRSDLAAAYRDPSVQHFLEAKAWKIYEHPGVNSAVNKTFKYVLPTLQMRYDQGKKLMASSHRSVHDKLNAYVGTGFTEPYLPLLSGMLVYGIAFVPSCCALLCLTRVLCQRRWVLIFCHVWFMWSCIVACGFAVFSGKEPLAVLAMHDASLYLFSQVTFGFMLMLYTAFLMVSWTLCSAGGTREPCYRMIQTLALIPVLAGYFHFIWTPAIQDRLPEMDNMMLAILRALGTNRLGAFVWIPYLIAAGIFAAEGVLELLCFRAAQYSSRLRHIEAKVDVRNLEELSALVPGKRTTDIEEGDKRS